MTVHDAPICEPRCVGWDKAGFAAAGPPFRVTRLCHDVLVTRLCLVTHFPEALLPVRNREAELRESVFPSRAWEQGSLGTRSRDLKGPSPELG